MSKNNNKSKPQPSVDKRLLDQCLKPLLAALEWHGSRREFLEALPHLSLIKTVEEFCNVMKNLSFSGEQLNVNLADLDGRLLPGLFIPTHGHPMVLIERVEHHYTVFDSRYKRLREIDASDMAGCLFVFKQEENGATAVEKSTGWFRNAFRPQMKSLYYVGFLSLIQTLMMLIVPIFIMSVYDKVIGTRSIPLLGSLLLGTFAGLLTLVVVLLIRARMLGHIGVYIQRHIGNTIFQRLLFIPSSYTESATVGAQLSRLDDFNSVRDFFGGPLFGSLIEVPFIFIYLLAVWFIGGVLVVVPIFFVLLSVGIAYILWRISRRFIRGMSSLHTQRQEFIVETLQKMRSLKYAGLQRVWEDRYCSMSSEIGLLSKRSYLLAQINEIIFDILIILAGLFTLMIGAALVLNGVIQIGGLIATMFIVWRILTPIKVLNTAFPRLAQLRKSTKQINNLMKLAVEKRSEKLRRNLPKKLKGEITFNQVSFRYPDTSTSALMGINFKIEPGQTIALIGPSAAGKSTLLKLILAIYTPQVGEIFIDGYNILQYDPTVIRANIAYVPQRAELFYGTIAQNLKLAEPSASLDDMKQAAKQANILQNILALPNGFDTRLDDHGEGKISMSLKQGLCLARAYLRKAPILILDEPGTALDNESDKALMNAITQSKGKRTTIITSHRPSHIKLADLALVLQDGKQLVIAPPDVVLEKMPKELL